MNSITPRIVTGASDTAAITLSTIAVAVAFQPVRRWVQLHIDRRFYRESYVVQATVDAFNERLREQIDLDALCPELQVVVGEAIQPAHTSIWLRRELIRARHAAWTIREVIPPDSAATRPSVA